MSPIKKQIIIIFAIWLQNHSLQIQNRITLANRWYNWKVKSPLDEWWPNSTSRWLIPSYYIGPGSLRENDELYELFVDIYIVERMKRQWQRGIDQVARMDKKTPGLMQYQSLEAEVEEVRHSVRKIRSGRTWLHFVFPIGVIQRRRG